MPTMALEKAIPLAKASAEERKRLKQLAKARKSKGRKAVDKRRGQADSATLEVAALTAQLRALDASAAPTPAESSASPISEPAPAAAPRPRTPRRPSTPKGASAGVATGATTPRKAWVPPGRL